MQYGRGEKVRPYFTNMLGDLVKAMVDDDSIDLETDPLVVSLET